MTKWENCIIFKYFYSIIVKVAYEFLINISEQISAYVRFYFLYFSYTKWYLVLLILYSLSSLYLLLKINPHSYYKTLIQNLID